MARINIESQFWIDVMEVAARMGDSDKAVGQALKLIKFGQDEYKKGKRISIEDFRAKFSDKLMPEFAYIDGEQVVIRGADKFFGWLETKKQAGRQGGVKSGKSRRSKTKQNEAKPSKPKQAEPSYSSSISSSSSDSGSIGLTNAPAEPSPPVDISLNAEIWKAYSDAYFARYGTEPVRNARVNTQVAQLAKRLGAEAVDVVRFYVGHSKSFYVGKLHDIGVCLSDAEALRTQWATNRTVTQRDAQHADDSAAVASQLQRIREGKL